MNVVWKYHIPTLGRTTLSIPLGAELIEVYDIEGQYWLWALVDPDQRPVHRVIELVFTGHEIKGPILTRGHITTFANEDRRIIHAFDGGTYGD